MLNVAFCTPAASRKSNVSPKIACCVVVETEDDSRLHRYAMGMDPLNRAKRSRPRD